jgi:hypothetical protein
MSRTASEQKNNDEDRNWNTEQPEAAQGYSAADGTINSRGSHNGSFSGNPVRETWTQSRAFIKARERIPLITSRPPRKSS